MQTQNPLKKLTDTLSIYTTFIGYSPLPGEVSYAEVPLLKGKLEKILLASQEADSDPHLWAAKCMGYYKSDVPCILVPGTAFDLCGTRHGRGRGWYDRFLADVPRPWLRVGVTDTSRLSSLPLMRQVWDEPVDWLLVRNTRHHSWEAYETLARSY